MTKTPDIWVLHTTNPREGESEWGGCYIVETDAHNDAATMRKVTGLDWEVVPMVRADSLGKCLHQIAAPQKFTVDSEMSRAFEVEYGQDWADPDWRREAGVWASAWRKATNAAFATQAKHGGEA